MKTSPKPITPVPSRFSLFSKKERENFKIGKMTISAEKDTAKVAVDEFGQIYIWGGKDVCVKSDIFNKENSRITAKDSEISSIFTGYGKDIIELHNCQFKNCYGKDIKLGGTSITLRGSNNVLYVDGDLRGYVDAQQDSLFNGKEKADKIIVNGTNYATIQVDSDDKVKTKNNEGTIKNIVVVPVYI